MKNYLIVGASSGIGKELGQLLQAQGHSVYATYNKSFQEDEERISFHHLDIEAETINLDFLPESLDGFVYCPGSINLKPFKRIKPADFLQDYNLQVVGAIKVLQAVLPRLQNAVQASVVMFSTVAVKMGFTFHSQVASSKGAIEGLTRSLAAELSPNIRINAIAPSLTDTPLAKRFLNTEEKIKSQADKHPLKRIGTPLDLAQTASFLLGDQSSWLTGQVIGVDGGYSSIK